MIEESYYTIRNVDGKRVLPHLFLFEEVEGGDIKLISYEIPKKINKIDFKGSNKDLLMDYNELEVSEKFAPIVYEYKKKEGFYGKSFSIFGPETTFLLEETISKDKFVVSGILKKDGKVLVGNDSPIVYDRLK